MPTHLIIVLIFRVLHAMREIGMETPRISFNPNAAIEELKTVAAG